MSVTLTEAAARQVKQIMARQIEKAAGEATDAKPTPQKMYLRVGVKGGGCSGFNYTLDLTDRKAEDDEVFEQHGVEIVCDPKSYLYLAGTCLDYREELLDSRFVFHNPNASGTCGCGASFST